MKITKYLALSFAAVAIVCALASPSCALDYPTRPVRLVVGFPPGGSADIVARIIGQALTERMGQSFVVDNKPGAGSNLGTDTVARAEPDGYTLMAESVSNAINPTLYKKLTYDQLKDLVPVASIDVVPNVMDINVDVPAKTVPEFIAYAKANPGKISMGSGGIGSSPHVAGELFKMMTGVQMEHIPYRGVAPATADLLGGRIQVLFDTLPAAIGNIRAGKIRALAVSSKKRSESLPDVPAMNEFVPGYEADSFHGISAPKGTPREIVEKLNREINAALADPKVKARLAELGAEVFTGTPEDYGRYLAGEIARWAKVIEFSGAKAE
ncbi:Bug family tripartite tricarboxylate transporter substrate binding protein [Rhodoplanes sp. Z2-YC6860]|uniref:Bug family tripartite tricarboxylate transporter substrate binding protein n=1 Tax=Rhodoplanes sp. Z2-YC6860 TaxID=674703 RepID=UPI00078C0023|nr:tripartite tricarboxylate transporter substrate binding protein [Rhodoplanes sp. Z2-YC6860]AMN40384.1 extra-cytoplasmic solute receptor family protein [Rhodoplanes sp. Z2-YC6860]